MLLEKINGRAGEGGRLASDLVEEAFSVGFQLLRAGCVRFSVEKLVEMISLMETDFNAAYEKSFEIEKLKRNARGVKYDILDVIYQKSKARSLQIYLTSKICIKLFDMIKRAEEISDFLRSLIVKYPSK